MALGLTRPLKVESVAEGGLINDAGPTELDPHNDAIPLAAIFLQVATGNATVDQVVGIDRTNNSLRLTDGATSHILSELVSSSSGQVGSHNALVDAIHYMADGGPADGYASGSFLQITRTGPLVTSQTWWTSSTMTNKIISVAYTYSGPLVTQITRTLYGANNAVARTLVDTLNYSGAICTSMTRTWT